MPLTMRDAGSLKVAELKEECRARGLKVSGVKQELVDRVKAHLRTQAKAKAAAPAKPRKLIAASAPSSAALAVRAEQPSKVAVDSSQSLGQGPAKKPETDAVGASLVEAHVESQQADQSALRPPSTPLAADACLDAGVTGPAPVAVVPKADESTFCTRAALTNLSTLLPEQALEQTCATAHCTKSSNEKPERSRSPPAWLKSIPTATRRRHASPLPERIPLSVPALQVDRSEQSSTRSRSPLINRVAGDQGMTTPSKFSSILENMKAKLEAKERGEEVSSRWTPRASPLRSQIATAQTPPRWMPQPSLHSWEAFPHSSSSAPAASLARASSWTACAASPRDEASNGGLPALSTPLGKRQSLLEDKKQLLQQLTEKLQLCLRRVQDKSLDEKSAAKYQELAKAIQKQMDTISIHEPEKSPAFARSPAMRQCVF